VVPGVCDEDGAIVHLLSAVRIFQPDIITVPDDSMYCPGPVDFDNQVLRRRLR
jgi:hypothetical protein